jgi:hypothetical protein
MRKHRQGTYQEFKKFTLGVVKGKRKVDPDEPKLWVESAAPADAGYRSLTKPDDPGAQD